MIPFVLKSKRDRAYPVNGRLSPATVSPNQGYIALISVFIIGILLITITVAMSFSGFMTRFSILENEYKEISVGLADACADRAILKLAENWSYASAVEEDISVGLNNCQIISIEDSGAEKKIRAKGVYQNSHTNLEIKVEKTINDDILITSWEELANF